LTCLRAHRRGEAIGFVCVQRQREAPYRNTFARLARALQMLRNKQLENPWKKHDNIPL
jgi:hypothetical protein